MPQLDRAVARELNALVLGARGSGKTTLLRALEAQREDASRAAIYVDLGPAQNAAQALAVIADALGQKWGVFGENLRSALIPETTPSGTLLRLARRLGEAPPSLILVDSLPAEGNAHVLFGSLRDELWQQGHQWVVAANEVLRDELTRPPADAFFDVRFELSPLPEDQQRVFLQRRLAGEPSVNVDALIGETDGLPRSLVSLARAAVLSEGSVDHLLAERDRHRERLEELPQTASAIVEFLSDHGPTSGSDPALLASLGVSGQRARHVLRTLENEGLVRSFPEQHERQGRPRKLYELCDRAA